MKRFFLVPLCAAFVIAACDSPPPTGLPRHLGPSFAVTAFSAIDPDAGPGDPRPNADAAAASFDVAASALGPLSFEDFESAPLGNFTSLSLAEMNITLSGTGSDVSAGITNVAGDAIFGYNTTIDGSNYLRFVPPFGAGTVTAAFTPNVPLQAWGAYFTGVGTVPNTSVEILFDDGTAQTFAVPGDEDGGATFFGFTDAGKTIASVTVRETLTSTSTRDILSIDDVRFVPAGGTANQERVPAGAAATIVVQQECDAEPDGQCAVAGIDIPAGTFDEDVIVTVRFEELEAGEECHDFIVGQKEESPCVEINVKTLGGEDARFTPNPDNPVVVGFCLPEDVALPEIFKFKHRDTGPVVALRKTTAGFLNCSEFASSSATPSSWLHQFAGRLLHGVERWFLPKPLIAAVDRGFGGIVDDGTVSFFTWADAIEIARAGVAINVLNSGKDGFGVQGTFNLEGQTLTSAPDVVVRFGDGDGFDSDGGTDGVQDHVDQTIPGSAFRFRAGRWVFTAPKGTTTGVLAMELHPDGKFGIIGGTLNDGDVRGVETFRTFSLQLTSLQIGQKIQGTGLECDADGKCTVHVD